MSSSESTADPKRNELYFSDIKHSSALEDSDDDDHNEELDLKPIKEIIKGPKKKSRYQQQYLLQQHHHNNNSNNSRSKTKLLQSGGLLPPSLYKNPSTIAEGGQRISQEIDEIKFKDPLSRKTKLRLVQVAQDYVVSSALSTLLYYVLGRNMKATVYPVTREQLKTQQEVDARLNDVVSEFALTDTSLQDLQDFIDMVDLNCGLYEKHLPEAMAQAHIFGRSALWIVRANESIEDDEMLVKWGFREGVPISLRPLDSANLGQVIVDTKSWEPKRIEYEGNLGNVDQFTTARHEVEEIDISELIYFTRDDYNIVPDSYNYGSTRLLDAISVSENKRRLTKKVFAEINNNQWAGLNIFEIAGMSSKDMQNFALTLMPGKNKITNQPIKVHNISPQFDMHGNLEQLKQLTLELLMAIKVPSFLMNYESVTNRATSQAVAHIWQQTVLEAERNWLRNVLWKYWYKPLMEFYFPDKRFLYMKIKIILEFQSIEFSSLFEKAIAINNLYQARIITLREAREMINLPPFPPDQENMQDDQAALIEQILKENPDIMERAGEEDGEEGQQNGMIPPPPQRQREGGLPFGNNQQQQGQGQRGIASNIRGKTTPELILTRLKAKKPRV